MAEEKMTLVEKLRNPSRIEGGGLNEQRTLQDMEDAADIIEGREIHLWPLRQVIGCNNCECMGWRKNQNGAYSQCAVCEGRGLLVIDERATMERPIKDMPRAVG